MQQEPQKVKKLSIKYMRQSCMIVVVMTSIMFLIMGLFDCLNTMVIPTVVSLSFFIMVEIADVMIWRWVATKHSDGMSTFFTGVSGFRMLLAIAVMFVYYLLSAKGTMLTLFLVFMAYYIVLMAHHSYFFVRLMQKEQLQ